MKVVGIVGGVASGKSEVARMFQRLGAVVIDADREGHAVLEDPKVLEAARGRWGTEVLNSDGTLNRRRIADHVFGPTEAGRFEREFWNRVTHPRIGERIGRELRKLEQDGADVVCLDAALLLEAGWDLFCDFVVFVDCSEPLRLERAIQRGWNRETLAAREAAQFPLTKKRQRSYIVIDNSGDFDQTYGQVREAWLLFSDSTASPTDG